MFLYTLRDIMEKTYRCTFHLQYKTQSTVSKNQAIHKQQKTFLEQWSMQHVRLAMAKTYNSKK